MLAYLDLHQKVSGSEFKRRVEPLQWRLYALQQAVFRHKVPVLVVLEGWAAAGKGGVISLLAEQLDPRGMRVVPVLPARPDEQRYPWLRRYWLNVPAAGQIVIFDSSWYRRVLIERLTGEAHRSEWQAAYQDIVDFEQMLTADGVVLLKFWLHISKKTQRRRIETLLDSKLTRWQVDEEDQAQHKAYRRYYKLVEIALARTEAPAAAWNLVEATDKAFAQLKVLETVVNALEQRLGPQAPPPAADETAASAEDTLPSAQAEATAQEAAAERGEDEAQIEPQTEPEPERQPEADQDADHA
jgi:AMP-polyphosphate phosphotransferase